MGVEVSADGLNSKRGERLNDYDMLSEEWQLSPDEPDDEARRAEVMEESLAGRVLVVAAVVLGSVGVAVAILARMGP